MAGFNFAALDKAIRSQPTYNLGFAVLCDELASSIEENAENPKDLRNLAINLRKQAPTLSLGIREVADRPEPKTPAATPAEKVPHPPLGSIPPINPALSKFPGEGELRDGEGNLIPSGYAPSAFPSAREAPASPFGPSSE